jgi:septum formation protein
VTAGIDEMYPAGLDFMDIPEYLARKKAKTVALHQSNSLIIAADTIVVIDNTILGKPENTSEARMFLNKLSAKTHRVVTGVCIQYHEKISLFRDTTLVTFGALNEDEINYYLDNYQPMDKAGAYGIQEWIGMIGVTKIEGSYFNVVGLPVHKLYRELKKFQSLAS